jgi:hypothetical protein
MERVLGLFCPKEPLLPLDSNRIPKIRYVPYLKSTELESCLGHASREYGYLKRTMRPGTRGLYPNLSTICTVSSLSQAKAPHAKSSSHIHICLGDSIGRCSHRGLYVLQVGDP